MKEHAIHSDGMCVQCMNVFSIETEMHEYSHNLGTSSCIKCTIIIEGHQMCNQHHHDLFHYTETNSE